MDNGYIYAIQTVKDDPMVAKRKLIRNLFDEDILTKKEDEEGKIYLSDENDAFLKCLHENKELVKKIEEWEFKKSYKYSLLYTYVEDGSEKEKIEELIRTGKLIKYRELDNGEYEELHDIVEAPSYLEEGGLEFIKFNLKVEAIDANDMQHKKRYPVLVCIYHDMNIIEIRFDSLGTIFGKDKMDFVYGVIGWIQLYLYENLQTLDLDDIVEEMRRKAQKSNEITIVEQDMRLSSGGTATIGIGKSNSKSLPFLGELKEIMDKYNNDLQQIANLQKELEKFTIENAELAKCLNKYRTQLPKIRDLRQELEDFILEKEELSEYPWTVFRFEKENYDTKIIKNYKNTEDWLIQHFYSGRLSNIGKERMENVTRYINNIRKDLEEKNIKCDPTGEID